MALMITEPMILMPLMGQYKEGQDCFEKLKSTSCLLLLFLIFTLSFFKKRTIFLSRKTVSKVVSAMDT